MHISFRVSEYRQFSKLGLFIRVPYYVGDPKRDPNLENYPYARSKASRRTIPTKDRPAWLF